MADLDDVANAHINSAKDIQSSSVKYIIGFVLMICFCWYLSETLFYKTKYDIIKLNKLELKFAPLRAQLSKGNISETQQNQYNALKKKLDAKDSTTIDTYKTVEENIPPILQPILKQATKKPYGISLTSLTILFFIAYLYGLRKKYLFTSSVALRILTNGNGYNKIFDHNMSIPFWALPIPSDSANGVAKIDLIIIGGLKRRHNLYTIYITLLLLALIAIQIRLYYISIITNSYLLNWLLFLQSLALAISLMLFLFWLLPSRLRDDFNHEPYINYNSRRNFIYSASLIGISILIDASIKRIRPAFIKRLLYPRYVLKKKRHKKKRSDCYMIETRALEFIRRAEIKKAAEYIYREILKAQITDPLKQYIRLLDLLIWLCFKDKNVYNSIFNKTILIAKHSGDAMLVERGRNWETLSSKRIQQLKKRTSWSKHTIYSKYFNVE